MPRLRTLFDRMIFLYFIIGIVPLLLILSLFLRLSTDQFSEKIKETFSLQSQNSVSVTNAEIDSLLHQIYATAVDDETLSILRQYELGSNPAYAASLFRAHCNTIRNSNSDISDFVYLSASGEYIFSPRYRTEPSSENWDDSTIRNKFFSEIVASNSIQFFTAENNSSSYQPIYFYLGIPIHISIQREPNGILLIAVNRKFFDNIPQNISDNDLNHSIHDLIVDDKNTIVYCNDASLCGYSLDDYLSTYAIDPNAYTLSTKHIKSTPWQYFSYIPHSIQFNSLAKFQNNIYILLIVLCILVFLMISSTVVSQNIRIRSIAQSIVQYDGTEQDYKIPSCSNPILQEVVDEFNAMTTRIQSLIEELKQKEYEIADSLNRQRIAEIKTMEAQINPHFLSNTLNTISWAAIEKGEFEISDMICSIAHLLQYSIRNVDLPVYVSEEVAWIKDYMFLQKKRFANLFDYTITVKNNLDDCMLYKLLIQPLLENSILHAFDSPAPQNHISITIEPLLLTNQLQIVVSDNGHGIPEDILMSIQQYIKTLTPIPGSHIGLFNTIIRLRAYYGTTASFDVNSNNEGTCIKLTLPMIFQNPTKEETT